ncbi:helix-turn-helix domain-containing protein [Nonomuraea basaltis]|uniref:helix-turn-helix domain-containing protein n=1 Tax=Nonomuraea basaltis TaxID=2495887 RepID=UPI00110C6C6B|nr:helix-turn-helix transcriptional regulator [Nonomuraea basaltis]TMR95363.1 helix-turn-helix domain-containing protein [Nonomuraea basaltis]
MRSKETERFAAQIRALKDRAEISFEQLAQRTGISSSSLHRYCSGTKIPTGYGAVHTFAKACGASNEELRELHRLWALADASRSSLTAPDERATNVTDNEHIATSSASSADTPVPPQHPHRRRPLALATATVTVLTAMAAIVIASLNFVDGPDTSVVSDSGATARMRVFNIEERCRNRSDRAPGCSIGLAINPRLNYDAQNVVSYRVWHDDTLNADCVLYDGDEVTDEIGTKSTRWYRVQLNDVPRGHAWLSGIRTRDNPALPTCAL